MKYLPKKHSWCAWDENNFNVDCEKRLAAEGSPVSVAGLKAWLSSFITIDSLWLCSKALGPPLKDIIYSKVSREPPNMSFFHLLVGIAIWDCCLGSIMESDGVRLGLGTKKDSLPVTFLFVTQRYQPHQITSSQGWLAAIQHWMKVNYYWRVYPSSSWFWCIQKSH